MSVESIDPKTGAVADILGSAIDPREDPPLVRGEAEYTDDIQLENTAHMAVIRSQHGHAKLEAVDTSAAEEMDGVVGSYTHEDLRREGTPGGGSFALPVGWVLDSPRRVDHSILADGRVRIQGDSIAVADGGADPTDAAPSDSASVDVGTNGDDE